MAFYRCTFYPGSPTWSLDKGQVDAVHVPSDALLGVLGVDQIAYLEQMWNPDVVTYIYIYVYIYIYDVICSWCFRNPIPIISDHPIPYTWNV